jgi:hypothetical protein
VTTLLSVNRNRIAATAGAVALTMLATGVADASTDPGYRTHRGQPLTVTARQTVVSHTNPAHGTVTRNQDGTLRYTPATGFTGTDSFTYTETDAVRLYTTHLPPLAVVGGVPVTAGGYGSSLAPVPGSCDEFYGLTDRGPNVDGPNGGEGRAAAELRPGHREVPPGERESGPGAHDSLTGR